MIDAAENAACRGGGRVGQCDAAKG